MCYSMNLRSNIAMLSPQHIAHSGAIQRVIPTTTSSIVQKMDKALVPLMLGNACGEIQADLCITCVDF